MDTVKEEPTPNISSSDNCESAEEFQEDDEDSESDQSDEFEEEEGIEDEQEEEDTQYDDDMQSHFQQVQPFNLQSPQEQVQQIQKMRDDVQKQLELCLTDMLVNLYNSKD